MAWWTLAGVDAAVSEEPCNWLKPAPVHVPSPDTMVRDAGGRSNTISPTSSVAQKHITLPGTLEAFHQWLAIEQSLPESGWIGPRILPTGLAGARLMVVTDMPDADDTASGEMLSGERGRIFDAMLRAIGLARSDIYLAALAIARPPGGIVDETDMHALVTRMRHHIGLVRPMKMLVLGEKAGQALFANENMPVISIIPQSSDAEGLRQFNHQGGTLAGVIAPHPRRLLRQSAAKAGCWKALQLLIEGRPS